MSMSTTITITTIDVILTPSHSLTDFGSYRKGTNTVVYGVHLSKKRCTMMTRNLKPKTLKRDVEHVSQLSTNWMTMVMHIACWKSKTSSSLTSVSALAFSPMVSLLILRAQRSILTSN